MKKDTLINLRVSNKLKEDFQAISDNEGFSMSQVLEASMKDIVKRNSIPNNIKSLIQTKREVVLTIPFIKQSLDEVISKLSKNKIKSVALFGSYAKGSATPKSDVDLFLDVEEDFSLFDLGELKIELEKQLSKEVDLATDTKDEHFISHIKKEMIILYQK